MKQAIQQEAEKAAKKIREALEEFNRVTGFELKASADGSRQVDAPGRDTLTGRGTQVVVWVQGLGVTA